LIVDVEEGLLIDYGLLMIYYWGERLLRYAHNDEEQECFYNPPE